jgi:hypothetical protein
LADQLDVGQVFFELFNQLFAGRGRGTVFFRRLVREGRNGEAGKDGDGGGQTSAVHESAPHKWNTVPSIAT